MSIRTIRSAGLLAACTIASIALPAAAQELEPKVFLQTSDDLHFVKVDRQGTTCIMTFVNEKDQTGVNLLVGRTVLTNQLSLFAATDIGTHGATFELNRRTLDGVVASRTAFSKKSPKAGFYQYSSSLAQLRFDFDDVRTTGGFLLTEAGSKEPALFVGFDGVERDRAVAAMAQCVESLPEHWSLDD